MFQPPSVEVFNPYGEKSMVALTGLCGLPFAIDFSRLVSWVILMDQYPLSLRHANRRGFV